MNGREIPYSALEQHLLSRLITQPELRELTAATHLMTHATARDVRHTAMLAAMAASYKIAEEMEAQGQLLLGEHPEYQLTIDELAGLPPGGFPTIAAHPLAALALYHTHDAYRRETRAPVPQQTI